MTRIVAKQMAARAVERSMSPDFVPFVAEPRTASTVPLLPWNWKWFRAAASLLALAALCAGCSGIHVSKSISPLDFLLPGLMKVEPAKPQQPAPALPDELVTRPA
jgi:hypothetical protein